MKGCIFCKPGGNFPLTFSSGREEALREKIEVCADYIYDGNLDKNADFLAECEVGFASWGMPSFTEEQIANNPQTVGMLSYELFSKMGDHATFINTGRGAQVVEADLIRALREEPGRSAILGVTDPEPTRGELLTMENVFLFPHIAGYARDEVLMMSDFMLSELDRYLAGQGLDERAEVKVEMLATMA